MILWLPFRLKTLASTPENLNEVPPHLLLRARVSAGAGGAAHLPGMLAAKTIVPVLGVPVASKHLQGVDSLHSIVQMPKGIPVATFAIGNAGAANAALFAVALLAPGDAALTAKLLAFRVAQTEAARHMTLPSHV